MSADLDGELVQLFAESTGLFTWVWTFVEVLTQWFGKSKVLPYACGLG
jgi:hypothetical protein